MSEKKPCDCNSCKLEAKLADVLQGQETSDGLPALTASLAEVIVQHADGEPMEIYKILKHTIDRLQYFTAQAATDAIMKQKPDKIMSDIKEMLNRVVSRKSEKKPDAKPDPLADLPADLPDELKSMLKGMVADGAEIKVVKIN